MLKKNRVAALAGLAMACAGSAAHAQLTASATISSQQLSANSYEYFINVKNTGSESIDAFWYGWFPGYDLLGTVPTSISSPNTWSDSVQQEASFSGSASVLWQSSTTPLAAGASLGGFNFITADPPSLVEGTSPVFGFPTEYSYIYNGFPNANGSGGALVVAQTVVPEPTSLVLLAGPMAWMLRRKRPPGPPGRR